jgi:hypothetical protein
MANDVPAAAVICAGFPPESGSFQALPCGCEKRVSAGGHKFCTCPVKTAEVCMLRALFRLVLLIVVLVGVGGFLLGWWTFGDVERRMDRAQDAVGTSGPVSTERARDAGARVGETAAVAANQAKNALENGAITAKIKSKMTLDDTLDAIKIDVDTSDGVVTLTGTVDTEPQHQRAIQLAKETDGVREVVDRIKVLGHR